MQEKKNLYVNRRQFLKIFAASGLALGSGAFLQACSSNEEKPQESADQKPKEESASAEATKTQSGAKRTVVDMKGNTVELPDKIERYADAWFAHNEVSIMLVGAEGVVATHCNPKAQPWMYHVNENMNKAKSTFGDDFNFEELVDLKPDVIFDSKEAMREKANEVGIPLVNCAFKTFEEMQKSVELTGEVFGGKAVEIAKSYNDELSQVLKDVTAKTDTVADDKRPKVLHGNSVYTLTIDGTGTIIDAWIKAAGGKNAVDESTTGTANAQFTFEQVIAWNPDVIITGKPEEVEQIKNDPAWQVIEAVKNGKVYVNPKGVFGWDRYGVEEILQVQWAAALLHPELFPDLDIKTKVKDFYKKYLNYELTDEEVELILNAQPPQAK